MESLNLNTLATSLPTPYQNSETDLVNNFKAAALSITTLYRSSRHASKRAYNTGYAAACNDLLMMIQQGVSVGGDSSGSTGSSSLHESDGMTIGKVMDWIEARMEAIKAREEEEDEDEEREKDRERGRSGTTTTTAPKQVADTKVTKGQTATTTRNREQTTATAPVPQHVPQDSSSPSPPPPPPSAGSRQAQRVSKSRSVKDSQTQMQTTTTTTNAASDHSPPQQQPFALISPETMNSPPMTMSIAPLPLSDVTAGTKRRHAVMMMLDSPSSVSSGSSAPSPIATPGAVMTRRRTRSSRGNNVSHVQNQNLNLGLGLGFPVEDMDVEEDGRERKRVARR